jgi:hypothetical protein
MIKKNDKELQNAFNHSLCLPLNLEFLDSSVHKLYLKKFISQFSIRFIFTKPEKKKKMEVGAVRV